jgi:hypothetical protein
MVNFWVLIGKTEDAKDTRCGWIRIHVGEVQAKVIGRSGLLLHGGVKRKMWVSKGLPR